MERGIRLPFRIDDENLALRAILEGTATDTGKCFFESLVKNLSLALGTYSAWVTEYLEETRQLRALAFWVAGRPAETFLIGIDGIWETFDRMQKEYGKKRFCEVIRNNAALSAEEILDAVYDDLKRFSLGTMRQDDITLVIVKTGRGRNGLIDYQI